MRDPVLYRIRRAHHHRTGDAWCIYPMYDYAHPISDALERITHSVCTLEFEDHRPLYDWLIQNLPLPGDPQQIEFARLNLTYTIASKRKLLQLVTDGHVTGWDDPRMPTLSGLRRRGYPPAGIGILRCDWRREARERDRCRTARVLRARSQQDAARWPCCARSRSSSRTTRGERPWTSSIIRRTVSRHAQSVLQGLYIEQDDFPEDPPKKFFRLAPGVRCVA